MEQPRTIRNAVTMMYIGAALSILGIIVTFIQRDEIRDQIRDSDETLTADELDTAVAVGLTFVVVTGLIGVGLWLWMASANGKGKSWARVVATVLGGLNIVFTLLGVALGQTTPLSAVASVVGVALAVAILVLLYRPDSNRYYDAMAPR
ncbi:MAG: hypothetical protein ACRD2C_23135 [Acidimicrobiales bacterium]